jgi:(p)ppGpp synthase/HD superfamily hydrolase
MENPVDEETAMETERGYSERYEQALRLAASAHRSQNRKAGDVPYITHPFHVSVILLSYGFSTDVAIAGLLHDVVEDQEVDLCEIEEQFGDRVARFVAALSERKRDAQDVRRDGPETWERFNRGPESQIDYYRCILEIARERLRDHPMVDEFAEAIEDLAQIVGLGHLPHT